MAAHLPAHERPSSLIQQHLNRIAAGPSAPRLKASLARSHARRSSAEVDDAVQDAFERAYACCDAESERRVYNWLWRTADRRLRDRARQLAREVPAAADSNVWLRATDERDPQHTLEQADEELHLAALFEQLAGELASRQRSVLVLHARGRERRALAAELGVSERIVKRSLEQILARARELLIERCGGGCERGTSDVWRLAFGLAAGSEAGRAQLHLMSCPTCQAFHERLGWWREAAAAAVPVPAAHELNPTLAEGTLARLADAAIAVKQQLSQAGSTMRQHATDAGAQVKAQATATYYRAADPTPLAGVRPGAATAIITGCLSVAGGGAYCLDQGLDPVRTLAGAVGHGQQQEPPARARPAQEPPPEQPVPAPPAPSPTAQPTPPPAALPPPPSPATEATPPPASDDEFDPASAAAAGVAPQPPGAPTPQPAPAPPAPAPAGGGGGEFGGP